MTLWDTGLLWVAVAGFVMALKISGVPERFTQALWCPEFLFKLARCPFCQGFWICLGLHVGQGLPVLVSVQYAFVGAIVSALVLNTLTGRADLD